MTDARFDAIVIGAGPAGASAAILLARAGWRIALVEKQPFPRRKVCGECIAATNLPLLDALGIGTAFPALAGPPLRRVAFMAGQLTIEADFPPYADGMAAWGAALGREYLDSLLLDRARSCGAAVFQPWTARAIAGGPGAFRCGIERMHSRHQMELAAPVLIDAHGSWEAAPGWPAAGTGRPGDLFAFKANFTGSKLKPGLLPVLSFAGGYGGMVIGGHETATLAFCIRRDMLAQCRQAAPGRKAAEAAFAHIAAACAGMRDALADAKRQGAWLSVGPLRPGMRLRHGAQAFCIGNAAAEAHPIIGEGMSMAIQSAWMLAERLAPLKDECRDPALQAALQKDYARAWRRCFAPRLRLAALFAGCAMRPALAGMAARLLKRYPQLLTHAARWSGKVSGAPTRGRLPDINERPA
jgi:2-polyprenyl-6-methoxyphenol hydroxylase-like FAD-dependent oxidoreductase